MNYAVFYNKRDVEKLALEINCDFKSIDFKTVRAINLVCDKNDYSFLIKKDIKKNTPVLPRSILDHDGTQAQR